MCVSTEVCPDGGDDTVLVLVGQARIEGEGKDCFGGLLCHRKITFFIAETAKRRHEVNRDGIVDSSFNATFGKVCPESISFFVPDDVEMIDMISLEG